MNCLEIALVSNTLLLSLKEKQLQLNLEIERLQSLVHDKLLLLNNEQSITAEDLNNIVKETVRIYVTEAGSAIQHSIDESQEKLMYEYERSTVNQDSEHSVKTSAGKAKSPGSGLGKRKPKPAKPAKG